MLASNNITNSSEIILSYQEELQFKAIIEIIRNHNAIQEEYRLVFQKYNNKTATIYLVSRAIIYAGVTNGVIKSCCGFNYYVLRDYIINGLAISEECTICLEIEI